LSEEKGRPFLAPLKNFWLQLPKGGGGKGEEKRTKFRYCSKKRKALPRFGRGGLNIIDNIYMRPAEKPLSFLQAT